MADWERRTRREYVLPNPTNWAEVGKVIDAIRNDLDGGTLYDDTVTVSATAEEIVFSYLAPEAA